MFEPLAHIFGIFRNILLVAALLGIGGVQCASAYTLLPPECAEGARACIKSGKLSYVSVYGPIRGQDEDVFNEIDALLPEDAKFPVVYLDSPGGGLRAAMAIGRILRAREAEVRSGSPLFPDKRAQCSSACTYIAAGAVRRYLSHVGIHTGYNREITGCGEWERVAMGDGGKRETLEFLQEMGISPEFVKVHDKTPSDQLAEFVLDYREPVASQEIYKLGFFQGSKDDFKKISTVAMDQDRPIPSNRTYLENVAKHGVAAAIWDLIEYLSTNEQGDESNAELAFDWLKQLVARNDGRAQYVIGNYYADGFGTVKDESAALGHYMLAAEQGVGQAQAIVGRAYFTGNGVSQDNLAALNWSIRAAERGEPLSYLTLCQIYGQLAVERSGRYLGARWCKLAVSSAIDVKLTASLEKIQNRLSKGMSGQDLVRVQDGALNWKPLQDKEDDKCAAGAERF